MSASMPLPSSEKPRLVFVANTMYSNIVSGGEIHTCNLTASALAAGYQVHFFTGHAFKAELERRGLLVTVTLTDNGSPTCDLPPATIAVTRTAGGVIGEVNESVYSGSADTGSNFRIDNCQYVYNLNSRALGVGIYRVDILINGQVVGSAVLELR